MSLFDSFISVNSLQYHAHELCDKLQAKSVYCYYTDKYNGLDKLDAYYYVPSKSMTNLFPENHVSLWKGVGVENWRRTFQINKLATVKKMGLEDYILKYHELTFHLTVKGMRVLFVMKFQFEPEPVVNFVQEESGQLCFNFN